MKESGDQIEKLKANQFQNELIVVFLKKKATLQLEIKFLALVVVCFGDFQVIILKFCSIEME